MKTYGFLAFSILSKELMIVSISKMPSGEANYSAFIALDLPSPLKSVEGSFSILSVAP